MRRRVGKFGYAQSMHTGDATIEPKRRSSAGGGARRWNGSAGVLYVLALISLAPAGCDTARRCLPAAFRGEWHGAAVQYDSLGQSSWTMRILLDEKLPSVEYKSLGCTAALELLDCEGNTVRFREHFTPDHGKRCVDGGITELTLITDTSARFSWYFADGRPGAVGSLFRTARK